MVVTSHGRRKAVAASEVLASDCCCWYSHAYRPRTSICIRPKGEEASSSVVMTDGKISWTSSTLSLATTQVYLRPKFMREARQHHRSVNMHGCAGN